MIIEDINYYFNKKRLNGLKKEKRRESKKRIE